MGTVGHSVNEGLLIKCAFFDELAKLMEKHAVDEEHAMGALHRLQRLEKNKPTGGEVARGAIAGTTLGVAGNVIGSTINGSRAPLRALTAGGPTLAKQMAASAVPGLMIGAALPLLRRKLDEGAEKETLRSHLGISDVGPTRSKIRQTLGVG